VPLLKVLTFEETWTCSAVLGIPTPMLHLSRRTRGATHVRTAAAADLTWRVAFPPAARPCCFSALAMLSRAVVDSRLGQEVMPVMLPRLALRIDI
jgi:hypothetical protein